MAKCSFCGNKMPSGKGKLFVKLDGKILHFDSSKCEKNFKMKREGVKTRWTQTFATKKQKQKK